MEHIADDIRKVLRRNHFFFITQFDNPLGNLAHRVLVDIDPQCFKVLTDIRLTGSLAKSIFADTAETFGQQIIAIQIVFAVTISMDTGTFGSPDDGSQVMDIFNAVEEHQKGNLAFRFSIGQHISQICKVNSRCHSHDALMAFIRC